MHILIVDDEPSIRVSLTELLADAGHQVRAAEHAPAALALLEAGSADLVLSDIGPAGPKTGRGTANCGTHPPGRAVCGTRVLAPTVPAKKTPRKTPVAFSNVARLNIFISSFLSIVSKQTF